MGVKFTQGYVTSPLCAPSRAGLLSGRHNQRVGVENNYQPRIDPNVPLFPAVFRQAGYATGLLGKMASRRPTKQAIDRWIMGSMSSTDTTRHS